MTNRTKAIIAGATVGAITATVALACFIKKHVVIAKVHIFDLSEQDEEKIDEMIPKNETPKSDHECNCKECACETCGCSEAQEAPKEAEV